MSSVAIGRSTQFIHNVYDCYSNEIFQSLDISTQCAAKALVICRLDDFSFIKSVLIYKCIYRLRLPGGGGGGGEVVSFLYTLARAQHALFTPKIYMEFQAPPKIFEILVTQKDIPFCTLTLKKTLKCIELTPKNSLILCGPETMSPDKIFIFLKATKILKFKGVRTLRGYFGPFYRLKLKAAFHQFHFIGLLEECPKCIILAFILLLPVAMVAKMADKKAENREIAILGQI